MYLMNDLRLYNYHPSYRYEVGFVFPPEALVKAPGGLFTKLLVTEVSENLAQVDTKEAYADIEIPIATALAPTISVTFIEDDKMTISTWVKGWMNKCYNPTKGYGCPLEVIHAQMKVTKHNQTGFGLLSNSKVDNYLVYPKGELRMSYSAGNSSPTTVSVDFSILARESGTDANLFGGGFTAEGLF